MRIKTLNDVESFSKKQLLSADKQHHPVNRKFANEVHQGTTPGQRQARIRWGTDRGGSGGLQCIVSDMTAFLPPHTEHTNQPFEQPCLRTQLFTRCRAFLCSRRICLHNLRNLADAFLNL